MTTTDIQSCFLNVAWLRPSECERKAGTCLQRLASHLGERVRLPIDIELLIELVDELGLEFVNDGFFAAHGGEILGMFDFGSRRIHVNADRNRVTVRLRWTLAHEYGHHVLHSPYFQAGQKSLFEIEKPTTLLYRDGQSAIGKLERQANMFAECILMPQDLVTELVSPFTRDDAGELNPDLAVEAVRAAAAVSRESARIRLTNLGLI